MFINRNSFNMSNTGGKTTSFLALARIHTINFLNDWATDHSKWTFRSQKEPNMGYLSGTNHCGTSQISVYQCPTFQQGSIFDPLLGVSRWFRDAHSVHGPSLWPARRFGTLYQTAWEIRILARTTSDVCWRRIYFHCTEAFSVLEMFQDDTLYKSTYLLTYFTLLIHSYHISKTFLFKNCHMKI